MKRISIVITRKRNRIPTAFIQKLTNECLLIGVFHDK